jgi:hypothetical protein
LAKLSGFTPAAWSKRRARFSVLEPGWPVETRLPFRSCTTLMPLFSVVTTWMKEGYM